MTVGRLWPPRYVLPQNGLMETGRLEDGSRIDPVVEEYYQRCSPVVPDCQWLLPSSGSCQLVSGEVERIEIGFGQIMSSSDIVSLGFRAGKSRQFGDEVSLPGPGHDRSKVLASLVRGPPGIGAAILNSFLVNPIQEFANVRSVDLIDINTFSPGGPLGDGRFVLFARSAREFLGGQVLC